MDLKLHCGEPHPIDVDVQLQKITYPEYILEKAKYHAERDNPVLSVDAETGREFRFSEFESLSGNVASWFFSAGMQKGDTVIHMSKQMAKLPMLLTGVWRANGVVRSSYPQDLTETLKERILESNVKWVYCEVEEAVKCKTAIKSVSWKVQIIVNGIVNGCVSVEELFMHQGEVPSLKVTAHDPALILLTSGTTGKSKGAVRNHRAVLCNTLSMTILGWLNKSLIVCAATHMTYIDLAFSHIVLGITCIPLHNSAPTAILKAIDKYKPRMVFGFPGYYIQALSSQDKNFYDLSSVEYVATGGMVITDTIKRQTTVSKYQASYLQASVLVSSTRFVDRDTLAVEAQSGFQVGKIIPGVEILIIDAETLAPVGPNQRGEILAKSVDSFSYYLCDPNKTAAAFAFNGYFKTGDIGSYDENGVLSVYGRSKEVFKYFNNHISPDQIDSIVGEHPAVLECCTIGITHTDDLNMVPRTFVVLKHGVEAKDYEIKLFAQAKLPDYMHLRGGLYIVSELPRGATGKVTRKLVSQFQKELMNTDPFHQNNNDQ